MICYRNWIKFVCILLAIMNNLCNKKTFEKQTRFVVIIIILHLTHIFNEDRPNFNLRIHVWPYQWLPRVSCEYRRIRARHLIIFSMTKRSSAFRMIPTINFIAICWQPVGDLWRWCDNILCVSPSGDVHFLQLIEQSNYFIFLIYGTRRGVYGTNYRRYFRDDGILRL